MAKRGGQKLGVGGGAGNNVSVAAVGETTQPNIITDEMFAEAAPRYGMTWATDSPNDVRTIRKYAGSGYEVNLRIVNGTLDSQDLAYIRNLNLSLDNLPTYKSPKPLYRGFKDYTEKFTNVGVGDLLTFNSFTSTSKSEKVAKEFAGEIRPVVFVMNSHKTGRDIGSMGLQGEVEVLFKTGTNWNVKKVEMMGNIKYIHVDEE